MYAELEHVSSLLRVWPDGEQYGDPYWGAAIRWLSRDEVEITLQQQKLTPAIYRATIKVLSKYGVRRILVRTYPNGSTGQPVVRWIQVAKPPDEQQRCTSTPIDSATDYA